MALEFRGRYSIHLDSTSFMDYLYLDFGIAWNKFDKQCNFFASLMNIRVEQTV